MMVVADSLLFRKNDIKIRLIKYCWSGVWCGMTGIPKGDLLEDYGGYNSLALGIYLGRDGHQ